MRRSLRRRLSRPVAGRLVSHDSNRADPELEEESPVVQAGRRFGVRLAGHASLRRANHVDSLEVRDGYALCESGEVLVVLESIHAAPNTLVLSGRRAWWEGASTTHIDLVVGPNELDFPAGTFRMTRPPR